MKKCLAIILGMTILSLISCSKRDEPHDKLSIDIESINGLTRIFHTTDDVELYVADDSIEEYVDDSDGTVLRKASVIYHFITPIDSKGIKISYMHKETFYSCKDHFFINGDIIFYDDKAVAVARGPKEDAQEVPPGSNVDAELRHVCGFNLNRSREFSPRKVMDHYDI